MNDSQNKVLIHGFEILLIFVIAFLARVVSLEHDPIHDELQHLLAARSWVTDGTFAVADGVYSRGALYTILVGLVYLIFDDSITTVRMSSVVLGSLWVVAVFVWCRYRVDRTVGWVAGLLMCFAPGAIFLSQYIRFYSLHGLLFWLGAIAVYELIEIRYRPVQRVALALGTVLFLGIAAHLQPTTLIGVAGLLAYVAFRLLPGLISGAAKDRGIRKWVWAGLIGCVAVAVLAIYSGLVQQLLAVYLWSPLWTGGGGPLRYHWMLVGQYPIIWATIPLAVLLVFAKKSAPGIFCAFVFCVAIVFHSFAGMKAERFIYYVMPFFFVLAAILVNELVPFVRKLADDLCGQWLLNSSPLGKLVRFLAFASIGLFLIGSNPALRSTADMLRVQDVSRGDKPGAYWTRYRSDWGAAQSALLPFVTESDVVVTTQGLHMLYFVGRFDVELSASRLSDLYDGPWDESKEFAIDHRTGRPVISSAASFRLVQSCFEKGTVVIRDPAWRNRVYVNADSADAIVANTVEISLPQEYGLRVFQWITANFARRPECDRLPASLVNSGSPGGQVN